MHTHSFRDFWDFCFTNYTCKSKLKNKCRKNIFSVHVMFSGTTGICMLIVISFLFEIKANITSVKCMRYD